MSGTPVNTEAAPDDLLRVVFLVFRNDRVYRQTLQILIERCHSTRSITCQDR